MGSGFSKMKKQEKQMQEQLMKAQEELKALEVTGKAGGELVQVTMNGDKEIKKLTIHPDCVDPNDVEGLQDLIVAAFEDAYSALEKESPQSSMAGLPFGI